MQVEIKKINTVKKEVTLVVEAERTNKFYQKYLKKVALEAAVPGFRKGKAPLSMVERMYSDKVEEYFYKEMVDDAFDEASREHDIHYLLYPEVKDIQWNRGEDMTIVIEIETEPEIEFKQIEGLSVPYKPLILEAEVDKYIEELRKENSYAIDVEDSIIEGDEVEFEIVSEATKSQAVNGSIKADPKVFAVSAPALIGKKIGDKIEISVPGYELKVMLKDLEVSEDDDFACTIMINAIRRMQVPELDESFAKDLEFDSIDQMKAKIAEDMQLKIEHQNINIMNFAVISKLYIENRFDLPEKTLAHIAAKEIEHITDENWKRFYEYQVKMQIAQEMVSVYTLNNLKKVYELEISDDQVANYIEHNAILEDKTVEAWKEANKKELEDESFKESVRNFVILRKIANSCDFYVEEPSTTEEPEVADIMDAITDIDASEDVQQAEIEI